MYMYMEDTYFYTGYFLSLEKIIVHVVLFGSLARGVRLYVVPIFTYVY